MNYILSDLKPTSLFKFFEEISAIPRGSGDERRITDYLLDFAAKRGLKAVRDGHLNVLICAPASVGYEDVPPILLQGHTDMVCEANLGTSHDFTRDGLRLVREGDILRADGTTLGADNGTAVAIMLAVLDDTALPRPALECLFTSSEETGLTGAQKFDYSLLSARKIINMDSDEEGVAVASCAGMLDSKITQTPNMIQFNRAAQKAITVKIRGLIGGHSGAMIHSGRKNAIVLAGRLMTALYAQSPFNLVSISGGNKRNAIPRECDVTIAVTDASAATTLLLQAEAAIRAELCADDSGFKILVDKAKTPEKVFSFKDTGALINFITLVPNGVITTSNSMPGLTESSSNLGVIRTEAVETGTPRVEMAITTRSSVEAITDHVKLVIERLCKLTGLDYISDGRHPGWAYDPNSALQKAFLESYTSLYKTNKERDIPRIDAIHAGLECGIICAGIKKASGDDSDAIAIGSDVWNLHSPEEKMSLSSLARVYRLVCDMIGKK